jgi:hypothetical protein
MRTATVTVARAMAAMAVILALVGPVSAQDDPGRTSREAAAAELIALLRLEEVTMASVDLMMETMIDQNPAFESFRAIFVDFFTEHYRWEELEPEYVRIYAEAYTEPEIRELIGFYQTPVGQKTVDLMPVLMRQGAEVGERQIEPHLPELQQRILEVMAEQVGGG